MYDAMALGKTDDMENDYVNCHGNGNADIIEVAFIRFQELDVEIWHDM